MLLLFNRVDELQHILVEPVGGGLYPLAFEAHNAETLTLEEYKAHSELFEEDLFHEISLETCISTRISAGSTGYESVKKQLADVTEFINGKKSIY